MKFPKMGKGGGRAGSSKGIAPISGGGAGGTPFTKGKAPAMPASNMGGPGMAGAKGKGRKPPFLR